MAHIIGCKAAHELTTCKQGMNQHAHVLYTKSKKAEPGQATAKSEKIMEPDAVAALVNKSVQEAMAKSAAWTDQTKTYYAGMKPDDQGKFLAKTADDQNAEAEQAKTNHDQLMGKEKAAKVAAETEIGKALAEHPVVKSLVEENKLLKAAGRLQEIQKRADSEFAGFPGSEDGKQTGREVVVETLKSLEGAPENVRTVTENAMKAQIASAKALAGAPSGYGGAAPAAGSAMQALKAQAKEVAKAKSIPEAQAFVEVSGLPENADLYRRALSE